eukprot:3270765-Pyramimonas_sp.AAC.2
MKMRGVQVDIRAPRQNARVVERRGAALRRALQTEQQVHEVSQPISTEYSTYPPRRRQVRRPRAHRRTVEGSSHHKVHCA